MREAYFIPVSEVVPQTEMISNWVQNSNTRFNSALQAYSEAWNQLRGRPDELGYENVKGERTFTAAELCVDGTIAYGRALKKKFPFIKQLKFINCYPDPIDEHTLLAFSVDGQDFFLDSTYGQINRRTNKVNMGKMEEFKTQYRLRELIEEDVPYFIPELSDYRLEANLLSYDFNDTNLGNIPNFNSPLAVSGIETRSASDYLFQALVDY